MNVRLYILQRATAALMVPLIVVHLILIIYATRNGVSAAAVLERTRGSIVWGGVLRCIRPGGIRACGDRRPHGGRRVAVVAKNWGRTILMWGFGLLLLGLGLRAVFAVVMPGVA